MIHDERYRFYDLVLTLMHGLELDRKQRHELMKKHCQPNPLGQYVLKQATLDELRALVIELNAICAAAVEAKRHLREAWDRQHERRPLAKIEQERQDARKRGTG